MSQPTNQFSADQWTKIYREDNHRPLKHENGTALSEGTSSPPPTPGQFALPLFGLPEASKDAPTGRRGCPAKPSRGDARAPTVGIMKMSLTNGEADRDQVPRTIESQSRPIVLQTP